MSSQLAGGLEGHLAPALPQQMEVDHGGGWLGRSWPRRVETVKTGILRNRRVDDIDQ